MARNRRNGRFSKSTRRTRRKPKTNLTNIATSLLVANSITQGAFNLNLKDFFFDDGSAAQLNPTRGTQITVRELVSGLTGGSAGTMGVMKGYQGGRPTSWGTTLGGQIQENLMNNAIPLMVGIIGVPIAIKTVSKLIRKPVILPANRMLKAVGMDVKV